MKDRQGTDRDRPLKIVYMSNSNLPSRTANSIHVMKMCQAFSKNGHQVVLIAPNVKESNAPDVDDIYDYYGVSPCFTIKRLPFWSRNVQSFQYLISSIVYCLLIILELLKIKPDIVYGRYFTGCLISVMLGIKTVFESHSPILGTHLRYFFLRILLKNKHFHKLVVISQALKSEYVSTNLIPDNDIKVVHDSSDENPDFEPMPFWPGRKGHLQVGYIGGMYRGRGIELMTDIASRIDDVDFHIIGGDRDAYTRLFGECNVPNVYFHGYVAPRETYKYGNSCDVLVA